MKLILSLLTFSFLGFLSCKNNELEPIDIHKDKCEFCKMSISDIRFACELVTKKGRIYKFDDILCVNGYLQENMDKAEGKIYVCNFDGNNELIPAENAFYIESDSLHSPMGGDVAAFKTETMADEYAKKIEARRTLWQNIKEK